MTGTKRKLLSAMLAAAIVIQTAMPVAFAAEDAESTTKNIVDFEALEQTEYTLSVGDNQETIDQVLTFPETITADVEYIFTEAMNMDSGDPTLGESSRKIQFPKMRSFPLLGRATNH